MRFRDRTDGGKKLAAELLDLDLVEPVVLALPRGGVPVAFEVAETLDAPLDVFVTRKVGAPGHAELGIGAIAEGGGTVANRTALHALGLSADQFDRLVSREREELERRVRRYRGDRPLPDVEGRDVVLVDDGLATGVTAEAALRALRSLEPRRLVLAVPVCARGSADRLRTLAEAVVYLYSPAEFWAVGQWYEVFGQTTDDEVLDLLARASTRTRR
jgi:putative phosphoribosyl transferase